MRKNAYVFLVVFLGACAGMQNTQKTGTEKVKITLPLVQSVHKGAGVGGIKDLRFHFEQEFVLTLADTAGNGVRKVTPQGNVILLSESVVRFPPNKLGKFVSPETAISLEKEKRVVFEQEDGLSVPELGTPELVVVYDSLGVMRVQESYLFNGKPAVKYQNAIYLLPESYKQMNFVVGQEGKGRSRVVRGVKTPEEEGM